MTYNYKYRFIKMLILSLSTLILFGCKTKWEKAIVSQNVEMISKLIQEGQNVNELYEFEPELVEQTALHYVTNRDYIEIINLLVDNGADVNSQPDEIMNFSPLMLAKSIEAANILIENGANINAKDEYGQTVIMHQFNNDIIKLILGNGNGINIEANTLNDGYISKEKAELLIENGANINDKDKLGYTALDNVYFAYTVYLEGNELEKANDRIEVMELLVDKGAKLVKDYAEKTILDRAKEEISHPSAKLIKILQRAEKN